MAYYHTCPHCGANLDPGENCDCNSNEYIKPSETKKEESNNVRNQNHSSRIIGSN